VRVEYPEKHEARETLISMNSPLRYQGITFFQYQMAADEMVRMAGRRASSTFQAVHNPSWLTPYLACVIVALGLVIQFGIHLVKFATKRGVTPKQQVNAKTQRGKDAKIEGAKLAPEVSIP
jgi:cytochrome c biogenesis protein ResB